MSITPESEYSDPRNPMTILDFLARLNEVTEEDVLKLRNHVFPSFLAKFDQDIDGNVQIMALLYKLSDVELIEIIDLSLDGEVVGLHRVGSRLLTLSQITGDEKFFRMWNERRKLKDGK